MLVHVYRYLKKKKKSISPTQMQTDTKRTSIQYIALPVTDIPWQRFVWDSLEKCQTFQMIYFTTHTCQFRRKTYERPVHKIPATVIIYRFCF